MAFFSAALGDGAGAAPPRGVPPIRGRFVDPDAVGEVNLNEEAARRTGAEIGDVIELRSYAPDQVESFLANDGAPDRGPRIDVEVVGIVRGSEDVAYNPEPLAYLSAAFYERYEDRVASCRCAILVNVAPGDVPSVVEQLPATIGDVPMVVGQYDAKSGDIIRHAVGLEVGALWIAAGVAGLASLIAIVAVDRASCRFAPPSVGFAVGAGSDAPMPSCGRGSSSSRRRSPRARVGAAAPRHQPVTLAPRGLARRAEPTPRHPRRHARRRRRSAGARRDRGGDGVGRGPT